MKINCPLCNEKMLYKRLENKLIKNNKTHFWSCLACPAVLIEYYNQDDINNTKKELNKLKPLIF